MIFFNYKTDFKFEKEEIMKNWISVCIDAYGFTEGELNYIFCNDTYLHKLNLEFLKHDDLTDIISFDYTLGKIIGGDIFISVERVRENALKYSQTFDNEINRVIIHGVLHFIGYKDNTADDKEIMRVEEDTCLELFKNK